jgi:hypothetical protein
MDIPVDNYIEPATYECIENAAQAYAVHPDILYAILMVEGGRVGESLQHNQDGSEDIGIAQYNSKNLDSLKQYNISKNDVQNNGCLAVYVAARHLQISMEGSRDIRSTEDYLIAIARYHSKTTEFAECYAQKLVEQFEILYGIHYDITFQCK